MGAKPEFNWRGHILLWDKLAKDGSLSKEEALRALVIEWLIPSDSEDIILHCFACEAERHINSRICTKKTCPLEWGQEATMMTPCLSDWSGLYEEWRSAWGDGDTPKAQKIAAQIRDLPLSENARKIYTIIE